jgi:uncharacterized protein YjiS (DUF1127 family)
MSAPMTKSQMAFELPKLSYIDTRWEEPAVQPVVQPVREHGFASWIAARVAAFRVRRANARALTELNVMSDRELLDLGLNRGDLNRILDDGLNQDLRSRGRWA